MDTQNFTEQLTQGECTPETLMQKLKKLEEVKVYSGPDKGACYSFSEPFEEVVYTQILQPEEDFRQAGVPMSMMYTVCGALFLQGDRLSEAKEAFEKALKWNPVASQTTFFYLDTLYLLGEMDKFLSRIQEAFRYLFHSRDVSQCYRNLGIYFETQEAYETADSCYRKSLQYWPDNDLAKDERKRLRECCPEQLQEQTEEAFARILEQYRVPVHATEALVDLAATYGNQYMDLEKPEGAKYFIEIACDLTENPEIKSLLATMVLTLEQELQKGTRQDQKQPNRNRTDTKQTDTKQTNTKQTNTKQTGES